MSVINREEINYGTERSQKKVEFSKKSLEVLVGSIKSGSKKF